MIISTLRVGPSRIRSFCFRSGPLILLADTGLRMAAATSLPGDDRFITETGLAGGIAALVEPVLQGLGYRLVRVRVIGGDTSTLQIMAERPDGTMTIEDCEQISRNLSPVLDAHDPVSEAYRLEISSPGIDRPLVRPSDFGNWAGSEAKIELKEAVNGRKRFKGIIEGFEDGEVRLECELDQLGRQVLGFPITLIAEARLVLTDELVRESLRRSKKDKQRGDASAAPAGEDEDGG